MKVRGRGGQVNVQVYYQLRCIDSQFMMILKFEKKFFLLGESLVEASQRKIRIFREKSWNKTEKTALNIFFSFLTKSNRCVTVVQSEIVIRSGYFLGKIMAVTFEAVF